MTAARKIHRWREVGRIPVTLIRHECACGCGRRRVSIVAQDGRGVALNLPDLGRSVGPGVEEKIRTAATLGRELLGIWQRAKQIAGGV